DANLYVIDAATGKDALMPRYVGNKCRVVKLEDSLLLISPSRSDSVMRTDLEGNVIWTTDLAYDMPNTDSDVPPYVQVLDSGYLISYDAQENGYSAGIYTALITHEGKIEFEKLEP
ncbi:MAG: hypothetical protein IIW48_01785, partial [Clostridia bacterium]|nr:hypothetical protein [Clostridia bacterium]